MLYKNVKVIPVCFVKGLCALCGRLHQAMSGGECRKIHKLTHNIPLLFRLQTFTFCLCVLVRVPTRGMMCLKTLRPSARGSTSRWARSSAVQRLSWPNSSRTSLRTNCRYFFCNEPFVKSYSDLPLFG